MHPLYSTLIQKLHEFAKKEQMERAVIGLSGGLDSAVAYMIAVRAFGPQNVTVLSLPEIGLTSNDDIDHAKRLSEHFNSPYHYQPINNFLVDFSFVTWDKTDEANHKLRAHIRAVLLSYFAKSHGCLILGTANKSDLQIGYGNKEGEWIGDVQVLGDLYKSEVMELAQHMGLPEELVNKEPSRELHSYQSDEGDLGAPWSKIDDILKQLEDGIDPDALIQKGMDALTVHKIVRMMQQNESKVLPGSTLSAGHIKTAINKAQEAEASTLI